MKKENNFEFNQEIINKAIYEAEKCSNNGETSFVWHSDMDDNTKFVLEKMGYKIDILNEYNGFSKMKISW